MPRPCGGVLMASVDHNTYSESTHRSIQARCGRLVNQRQARGYNPRRCNAAYPACVNAACGAVEDEQGIAHTQRRWRLQPSFQRERELQHALSQGWLWAVSMCRIALPIRRAAAFPGRQRAAMVASQHAHACREPRRMHTHVAYA